MRLVVWNCNMALHRTLDALASLRPDMAIIPECARPEIVNRQCNDRLVEAVVRVGHNAQKGLAVIGRQPWNVRLDESYDPSIRHVTPVHVDGPRPFRLLAVWAFNRGDNFDEARRGPLARGFERYHSAIVATLEQWGLFSVYHHDRGAGQGHEPEPTLYWRDRRADRFTYHIDYVFAPEAWKQDLRRVEVGDFASWVASGLSDHVPLIAEFAFHHEDGAVRTVTKPDAKRTGPCE